MKSSLQLRAEPSAVVANADFRSKRDSGFRRNEGLLILRRHPGERQGPASIADQCRGGIDAVVEIEPLRVHLFDEFDLPVPFPQLQLFLPGNGGLHGGVMRVPDQGLHSVARSEAWRGAVLVVPDAGPQIAGDADRECRDSGSP